MGSLAAVYEYVLSSCRLYVYKHMLTQENSYLMFISLGVFLHLTINLNEPKANNVSVKLPSFTTFFSLVFKSSAPQRNMKHEF